MGPTFCIVADGACSGNPGPGGWGLIVVRPDDLVKEYGGHDPATTNNRMELMGFFRGLQEVYKLRALFSDVRLIHAISDSKYVLDGAKSSVEKWAKNNWKTSSGSDVKNQDLWTRALKGLSLLKEAGFHFQYELVKGHSGHEGNERVDQIAVKYTHEEPIELYSGPIAQYAVKLESSQSLETSKPLSFKAIYLSLVGGVLLKHSNWEECKRAVDGKKGARFKKIKNALEEREILANWGVES